MRYTIDEQRRHAFRDWLRAELRRLDFYQRRGDRYLVSEFARYAESLGAHVEEVSLGRYLRDENPVLPTPESCRELARALGRHPTEVLLEAGYLTPEDFFYAPSPGVGEEQIQRQLSEIDTYSYLPEAIRAQMKASLERQAQQLTHGHTAPEVARPAPAAPAPAAPAPASEQPASPAERYEPQRSAR